MKMFKLLIVEDNPEDLATCRDSVSTYEERVGIKIQLVEESRIESALSVVDKSFDGAIVDLRFANEAGEGNRVVEKIAEANLRIPVAIFTGTPDNADPKAFNHIGIFKKGEASYSDILDRLLEIHNTGITRIVGGRGILEETLERVFRENILPGKNAWIKHGKADSKRTEKALLRYTLNCLWHLLDDDETPFLPEEFYIYPLNSGSLHTGGVVKNRENSHYFVILNPSCDLVIRSSGKFKTDRVLVGQVDDLREIETVKKIQESKSEKNLKKIEECPYHHPEGKAYKALLDINSGNIKRSESAFFSNTHSLFYHCLPRTEFFSGGLLNFRKLSTYSVEEFDKVFDKPNIQIAPPFVKDILGRFSSFYARQGQPDVEYLINA